MDSEKLEKYNLDDNKISKVNEFLENIRLKQYVTNVAPEYSVFLKPHANSVAEFIEGLSSGQNSSFLTPEAIVTAEAAFSNFTDVVEQNSDNINDISDAVEQNLENLQEAKETLFDIIKSYFGA